MTLIFAWIVFSAAPIIGFLCSMAAWKTMTVIGLREDIASWAVALPVFIFIVGRLWVEAFWFLIE